MKRSVSQSDVNEIENGDQSKSSEPKPQKQRVQEKESDIDEDLSEEEEGELVEDDKSLIFATLSNKWKQELKSPPPDKIVESPLEHACIGSKIKGLWLEFGVFSGKTINLMAQYAPAGAVVSGFDTFEGLPEPWRDKFDKGAFDRGGKFPEVASNVRLVKGLFQDTLENWIKQNLKDDDKIAICHLDADLYSATIFVLRMLSKYIVPGTILVFDELINFPGYEDHEWKALLESVLEFGWSFEWIGQAAVLEDPPVIDVWKTQQVGLKITGVRK